MTYKTAAIRVRSAPPPARAGFPAVVRAAVNGLLVVIVGALNIAPGFGPFTGPPVAFLSAVGALGAVAVGFLVGCRGER